MKALVGLPRFVYSVHKTDDGVHHLCRIKQNVGRTIKGSMDFRLVEQAGQPVVKWIGEGTATAQDALTVRNGKPDCSERMSALLVDGDNDSDLIRGVLMDSEGFSLDQTRRAVTKLRMEGKIEVIKLPGGRSVWRKLSTSPFVNAQLEGQRATTRTE